MKLKPNGYSWTFGEKLTCPICGQQEAGTTTGTCDEITTRCDACLLETPLEQWIRATFHVQMSHETKDNAMEENTDATLTLTYGNGATYLWRMKDTETVQENLYQTRKIEINIEGTPAESCCPEVTYSLPPEPRERPVWDKDGYKWEYRPEIDAWKMSYKTGEPACHWGELLHGYGPLTEEKPLEAQDVITGAKIPALPDGTAFRSALNGGAPIYKSGGKIYYVDACASAVSYGTEAFAKLHAGTQFKILEIGDK